MYILFSLLLLLSHGIALTQQQTQVIPPAYEVKLPLDNITYSYYPPIHIQLENGSVDLTIFRYVYPLATGTLNGNISKNRSLREVQCYTKLTDVPEDFSRIFEKKLEAESIGNNPLQAYIYDVVLWAHPYNNKTNCIPQPYLYNVSISVLSYVEVYSITVNSSSKEKVFISIPELDLNISTILPNQHLVVERTSVKYPDKKNLTLFITIKSDLPFVDNYLKSFQSYYDQLYGMFKKPYMAFGILFGIVLAILIAISGLLSFLSSYLPALIRKERNAFKRALGYHDVEALKKLILGIVLIVGGTFVEDNFSKKVYIQSLNYSSILDLASLDLFFVVSVAMYILGIIWIVDYIKDAIKGLIGGKEYYVSYSELITPQTLKRLLNDLITKINEFREDIGKALIEGVDVSSYLEEINTIPIHSLESEIQTSQNLYPVYNKIKEYIRKVEELSTRYRKTYEDVQTNYPFWRDQVKNEIKKYGSVSIDGLTMIPHGWRYWFAKKFVNEYPEFVIDENVIKRLNLPKKELLKLKLKQFYEDYPEIAIIVEDGTFYYDGPKRTLVKAILTKLLLSDKEIEAEGEINLLKTFSKYNIRFIVFGRKHDVEKLGDFYGL